MHVNLNDHFVRPIFAGLEPPTLGCFLAQVRKRYYLALRSIITGARLGTDSEDFWEGVAEGMVLVLYDVNVNDAYTKSQRFRRVQTLVRALREAKDPIKKETKP